MTIGGGRILLSFPRRADGTHDLLYRIQTSPDLLDWTDYRAQLIESAPSADPDVSMTTFDLGDTAPTRRFARLLIEFPP
jgi:hypothetical protein